MPRLFTGIEVPPKVAGMLSGLRGGLAGARWIDPENYHVTLRFIGDIDNRTANAVADILADVARESFTLRFDSVGAFGGNRPHALYASLQPSPELHALQAEHERLMQRVGLPPEGRKYTPHVTLARLRGVSAAAVANYIETRGGFTSEPFDVDRFVLFSARAGQGGGPYVVEESYPLDSWMAEEAENAAWQQN